MIIYLLFLVVIFTLIGISIYKRTRPEPVRLRTLYIFKEFYTEVDNYVVSDSFSDCPKGFYLDERILVKIYKDGSYEELK